jgi:hypothetical protein
MSDQLLTAQEVAARCGTSVATVKLACKGGQLYAVKIGRVWAIRPDDADRWWQTRAVSAGRPRGRSLAEGVVPFDFANLTVAEWAELRTGDINYGHGGMAALGRAVTGSSRGVLADDVLAAAGRALYRTGAVRGRSGGGDVARVAAELSNAEDPSGVARPISEVAFLRLLGAPDREAAGCALERLVGRAGGGIDPCNVLHVVLYWGDEMRRSLAERFWGFRSERY